VPAFDGTPSGGSTVSRRNRVLTSAVSLVLLGSVPLLSTAQEILLDEIVVSAQRRDQVVTDVPISMTVVGEELLEKTRATTLEGMQQVVPNFSFEKTNGFNNLSIRGVSGGGRNIGFDTRAGAYLDGVYVGQPQALGLPLFDVQRVEVLRGPQGHLFGRNTVSGAVSIVTRPPGDQLEGSVRAVVGNEGAYEAYGTIGGPLGETVSGKISAAYEKRDGFVENLYDGREIDDLDRVTTRGQLRFTPTDALTVDLYADYAEIKQETVVTGEPQTDFFDTEVDFLPRKPRVMDINTRPYEDVTLWGSALTINYELGNGNTITSITGYRDTDQGRRNDSDYSRNDILYVTYNDKFEQFSQELRIASPTDGRIQYVLGLYYLEEKAYSYREATIGEDMDVVVPLPVPGLSAPVGAAFRIAPGPAAIIDATVTTESLAAFAAVDFDLTDWMQVNLGARYTDEKKDLDFFLDGSRSGGFRIASLDDTDSMSNSELTPSVGLTFRLREGMIAYARWGSGFKSGGWNVDFLNAAQVAAGYQFAPETVNSYEVGLKGDLGRISFEVAAFRALYEDFQVFQTVRLPTGQNANKLSNAAKAESQGLEANIRARVTEGLTLSASLGLVDATYTSFPDGGGIGVDLDGNELQNAPPVTASVSADYRVQLGSGSLSLYGEYSYRDESYTQPTNEEIDKLDSRSLVNARATYFIGDGNWSVSVWGRNLLDELYMSRRGRDFLGNQWVKWGDPRTYGLEVRYDF